VIEDWRTIYNLKRPHSSRGWKPPAAYAASLNRQPGRKQPDSHNGWTDKRGPVTATVSSALIRSHAAASYSWRM